MMSTLYHSGMRLLWLLLHIRFKYGAQEENRYEIQVPLNRAVGVEVNANMEVVSVHPILPHLASVRIGDSIIAVDGRSVSTRAQLKQLLLTPSNKQKKSTQQRRVRFQRRNLPTSSLQKGLQNTQNESSVQSSLIIEPWLGSLELLGVGRSAPSAAVQKSRNIKVQIGTLPQLSIEAKLAKFGAEPRSCEVHAIHIINEDHMGCESRLLPSLKGMEFLVVERGRCSFAQKAVAAQSVGAQALIITDTAISDAQDRLEADLAFLKAHAPLTIPILSTSRQNGRLLREAVAKARNAQTRLHMRLAFPHFCNATRSDQQSLQQRQSLTTQAVRSAFRPSHALNTKDDSALFEGLSLELSTHEYHTLAINIFKLGPSFLSSKLQSSSTVLIHCRTLHEEHEDSTLEIANVDRKIFFFDLDSDCDSKSSLGLLFQKFSASIELLVLLFQHDEQSSHLLPSDLDAFLLPENMQSIPCATMALTAAGKLRSAFGNKDLLQVRAVQPRPRLLRTWRQLLILKEASAWPPESKLQSRVYGALRSLVQVPGGDEPDPDQWITLEKIWSDLRHP